MDLGDTLRFKSDLTDGSDVLTNATSVTLTITLPDGTSTAPSVTNPPAVTGKYLYDYATSTAGQAGRYVGQWLFTMAGGATTSYVETFDVRASLITVDEALGHLRAAGMVNTEPDLDQLQWLCFVATDAVERDLGRTIVRRTVTETYDGGRGAFALLSTPVVSVTSVVENGVAQTGFILRKTGWLLQRGTTTSSTNWAYGWENIVVTYVAGYNDPPPVVRKVALNTVQGMWQESQQAPLRFVESYSPDVPPAASTGALTSAERAAYDSLRSAGIA